MIQIKELAGEWFRERRLEPLSEASLERLLRSEVRLFEASLVENIASALSEKTKVALESMLQANPADADTGDHPVNFSVLKADAGRTSLKSVLEEWEAS